MLRQPGSCWHYGLLIDVTEHKHSANVKVLQYVLRMLDTDSQAYAYDWGEWQLRVVEVCSLTIHTWYAFLTISAIQMLQLWPQARQRPQHQTSRQPL